MNQQQEFQNKFCPKNRKWLSKFSFGFGQTCKNDMCTKTYLFDFPKRKTWESIIFEILSKYEIATLKTYYDDSFEGLSSSSGSFCLLFLFFFDFRQEFFSEN